MDEREERGKICNESKSETLVSVCKQFEFTYASQISQPKMQYGCPVSGNEKQPLPSEHRLGSSQLLLARHVALPSILQDLPKLSYA